MANLRRKAKLESLIYREISTYLIREVQNPKIGFVSVLRVKLNNDFTSARVYISILGPESEKEKSFRALQTTGKYMQFLLGKNLRLRYTPLVHFYLSDSLEEGDDMISRLSNLNP